MLSAVLAVALSFAEAQPVWPEEAQAKNSFVGFYCSFSAKRGEQHFLRMTGASIARVFLNGRHAGYGPARGPKGWARVDEWPLAVQEGVNHIALEVAGYRVSSYYHMNEEPFLQAEIVDGRGNVLAATGKDFSARRLDRVVKCSRMSFQRTFGEAYRVGRGTDAWRIAGIPAMERLKLSRHQAGTCRWNISWSNGPGGGGTTYRPSGTSAILIPGGNQRKHHICINGRYVLYLC